MSVLETISLCSIAFFASAISDSEKILKSKYLVYIVNSFDMQYLLNSNNLIITISITVFCIITAKNVLYAVFNYWSIRFSVLIEAIFAEKLMSGFINMPYEWHLSQNSSDLILVSANWKVYIGRKFIYSFLHLVADALLVLIMLSTLLVVQPLVSIIVIIILGSTSFFLFTSVRKKLDKVAIIGRRCDQNIYKQATKIIHGFKDLKIANKQNVFVQQYRNILLDFSKVHATQQVIMETPKWTLETMGFFMISFSICFMLIFLDYSLARISGTITLLAVTAWRVLPALKGILSQITSIRNSLPYINKILNYLDEIIQNEIKYCATTVSKSKKHLDFTNNIIINNVSFVYNNATHFALENINLTIQKGSIIGIIGPSGAGKSTFVDILSGLLFPSKGNILIDEKEINTFDLRMMWMNKLGYVPQTPYIFDGTIAENIAFETNQHNIDKNCVMNCCNMAAMRDFLDDLPEGINSYIGERGVRLSGGQRQRISIARTLYQKPDLIIFDEATSALDYENEQSIQNTIYSLRGKQTMVIVAHRLTTVESCDFIYELEKGKIKRVGTPQTILNIK